MSQFKATPLFDAHKSFVRLPMGVAMLDEYPDSKLFIETLCKTNPDIILGLYSEPGISKKL